MSDYKYVRRKDNPGVCLMAGYSDFTGQFDVDVYEQVIGNLPEDAVFENAVSPFQTLLEEVANLPAETRAGFAQTEATLAYLLSKAPADTEAATLLVEGLPDEPYEGLKLAMLGVLQ